MTNNPAPAVLSAIQAVLSGFGGLYTTSSATHPNDKSKENLQQTLEPDYNANTLHPDN
jgi:hypothetical protein